MAFEFCREIKHDESVRHGHFVLEEVRDRWTKDHEGEECRIRMTHATWLTLQMEERMEDFGQHAMALDPGEYIIPMSVMRAGDAADLARSLELIDPEPSATCIYPPCLLPTVTTKDGYPLCEEHHALLRGWEDLIVNRPTS